jgi:hypothetical protein
MTEAIGKGGAFRMSYPSRELKRYRHGVCVHRSKIAVFCVGIVRQERSEALTKVSVKLRASMPVPVDRISQVGRSIEGTK